MLSELQIINVYSKQSFRQQELSREFVDKTVFPTVN